MTGMIDKPYLVVQRANQHKEMERSAVGPFGSETEMIRFAQGIRFASGNTDNILGRSDNPEAIWITNPANLFPWEPKHLRLHVDDAKKAVLAKHPEARAVKAFGGWEIRLWVTEGLEDMGEAIAADLTEEDAWKTAAECL